MSIAVGQAAAGAAAAVAAAAAATDPREYIAARRIHAWRCQLRHKPLVVLDIVRIGIMDACFRMRCPQFEKRSLYRRSPTPHGRRWRSAIYAAKGNWGAQDDCPGESESCRIEGVGVAVEAVTGMQGWNSGSASGDGGEVTNIESL